MSRELVFLWVGKTKAPYARLGVEEYLGRVRRYQPCRIVTVSEERQDSRYSMAHRVERDSARILSRLGDLEPAFVLVIDPRGQDTNSRDLADLLRRVCYEDSRRLVFVVGGPDGLSSRVRDRADHVLGLSHLTFPHDMARLLLAEQVYRALTIIHGRPYDR